MAERLPNSKAGFGRPFAPPYPGKAPRELKPPEPAQTPASKPSARPGAPRPAGPAQGTPIPANKTEQIVEAIFRAPKETPELLQRCIFDVMKKRSLLGVTARQRFTGAVDISLASLGRSGRLKNTVNRITGLPELSPLGKQINLQKRSEPDFRLKRVGFLFIVESARRSKR